MENTDFANSPEMKRTARKMARLREEREQIEAARAAGVDALTMEVNSLQQVLSFLKQIETLGPAKDVHPDDLLLANAYALGRAKGLATSAKYWLEPVLSRVKADEPA